MKKAGLMVVFALLAWATLARAGSLDNLKIVFCRQIEDREPLEAGAKFPADSGWVYCHTTLRNTGEPTQIHHDWFYQGMFVGRQTLPVGASQKWRTFSSKPVGPAWAGKWEVVVKDAADKELGRGSFEVEPAGE